MTIIVVGFYLEQTPRNVELVTLLDSLVEGHLSEKDTYIRASLNSVCGREHTCTLLISPNSYCFSV